MVCLSHSLTVGVLASLVALEAAAVPVNQQTTFDGSTSHRTLRGMLVRYTSVSYFLCYRISFFPNLSYVFTESGIQWSFLEA